MPYGVYGDSPDHIWDQVLTPPALNVLMRQINSVVTNSDCCLLFRAHWSQMGYVQTALDKAGWSNLQVLCWHKPNANQTGWCRYVSSVEMAGLAYRGVWGKAFKLSQDPQERLNAAGSAATMQALYSIADAYYQLPEDLEDPDAGASMEARAALGWTPQAADTT
jgi:hypothetical protein